MPNLSLSPAIIEARAICPNNVFEIETLEIRHPDLTFSAKKLQLAFVVDNTGSQEAAIESIKTLATDTATLLSSEFETIEFALIQFKDEDETSILTGSEFASLAAFQTAIDTVFAGGGGDEEENGFGAVVLSATLPWSYANGVAKAVFLISDVESHTRGATQQQALDALEEEGIVFFYKNSHLASDFAYIFVGAGLGDYEYNAITEDYGYLGTGLGDYIFDQVEEETNVNHVTYQPLAVASGGVRIAPGTAGAVALQLSDLLKDINVVGSGTEPIFIVNDTVPHTLPLDDSLTPTIRTFETRGFKLRQVGSGENGLQSLGVTIDDIDRRVSQFVAKAKAFQSPVELIFRIYLSDDLTKPQNNPPTTLFLTSSSKSAEGFSGTCSTIDVVNYPFPNQYYRLEQFPL